MSDVPELTAHLGYWLRQVSNHVSYAFARKLAEKDVTVAEWAVMRRLYGCEPLAPSALAAAMGLSRGAISKLADRLIAKSLAAREDSADDGRAQTLRLTPRGERLIPELAALADLNDAECFAHLSGEDRAALLRIYNGRFSASASPPPRSNKPAKEKAVDDRLIRVAETCLRGAEQDAMTFPQIVGLLMEQGFESYAVDFRRKRAIYYLPDGDSVELPMDFAPQPAAATFDTVAIQNAIREAQQRVSGYTYAGFCQKVISAGCAGYIVSFLGRRAVYFGRTAETHVELFPQ